MREDEILDVVKKKRRRPDLAEAQALQGSGELIASQVHFARVINNLPDIDTNDAEAVKRRVDEYLDLCEQYQMRPLWAGLAHALGVSRRVLWGWIQDGSSKPAAVKNTLKKAHDFLAELHELWMATGQINPVTGIFLGKNNFEYSDKTEVIVTPNNPLGEQKDRAEIEARYRDAIVAPDDGAEFELLGDGSIVEETENG